MGSVCSSLDPALSQGLALNTTEGRAGQEERRDSTSLGQCPWKPGERVQHCKQSTIGLREGRDSCVLGCQEAAGGVIWPYGQYVAIGEVAQRW